MCLAIPARVSSIDENRMSTVDIMGVTRKVSLDLVPEAEIGDFVLVHAGFALQVIDEATANDTLDLLKTLPFFAEDEGLHRRGGVGAPWTSRRSATLRSPGVSSKLSKPPIPAVRSRSWRSAAPTRYPSPRTGCGA